jgi:TolA-binding protein
MMDEKLARMVKDVVSECVFELQVKMTELVQDEIASLESRVNSLEGKLRSLEGAAATKEPTSEFQSRLASLETAAAATSKSLEELRASRAKAPAAGSQTPATCYDIRQLEEKISTLASEVALAKRAMNQERPGMLQKFGGVEAAQKALEAVQASLREQVGAMEEQVGAMGDRINHSRIASAAFALDSMSLKESDRKMCLGRLRCEEDRLNRGMLGTVPGGHTGPTGAITLSHGAVPAPSLKHENRFKLLWRRTPTV